MGWDTVEPLEYGLKCNSVSKKCDVEEGIIIILNIENYSLQRRKVNK